MFSASRLANEEAFAASRAHKGSTKKRKAPEPDVRRYKIAKPDDYDEAGVQKQMVYIFPLQCRTTFVETLVRGLVKRISIQVLFSFFQIAKLKKLKSSETMASLSDVRFVRLRPLQFWSFLWVTSKESPLTPKVWQMPRTWAGFDFRLYINWYEQWILKFGSSSILQKHVRAICVYAFGDVDSERQRCWLCFFPWRKEIRKLLIAEKFKDPTMLLTTLTKSKKSKEAMNSSSIVEKMSCLWYARQDDFCEKKCYRKVFLKVVEGSKRLMISETHIFWSKQYECWKIGLLNEDMAGYLKCEHPAKFPWETKNSWKVVKEHLCVPWSADAVCPKRGLQGFEFQYWHSNMPDTPQLLHPVYLSIENKTCQSIKKQLVCQARLLKMFGFTLKSSTPYHKLMGNLRRSLPTTRWTRLFTVSWRQWWGASATVWLLLLLQK